MATGTSDRPPLHNDRQYRNLGATKLSNCSLCASSKATKTVTAVGSRQPQSSCRLFLLPPELRDMIYSYVFIAQEPTSRADGMTLLEAQRAKPAIDLLRTCQVIFQEAHETFEIARTNFWSRTLFYIHMKPSPSSRISRSSRPRCITWKSPAKDSVNELHDRELQRIQEVVVTVTTSPERNEGYDYEWRLSSCCHQVHGVHRLDWLMSYGATSNPPGYLSMYTITTPGTRDKLESLANLLEYLGISNRVG